jgi:phage tail-like protein
MAVLDPLTNYSFGVEITGVTIAQFKEVSGVGMVVSVIEHRANQVGGQPVLQKLPGSVHYDDIHLSRGKVSDPAFWAWIKTVQDGKIDQARKDGSIVLYDLSRGEVSRFNFFGGWPTRVDIGKLAAGGDQVMIESVTIAVERVEVA